MYFSGTLTDEEKKLYESQEAKWSKFKAVLEEIQALSKDNSPEAQEQLAGLITHEFVDAIHALREDVRNLFSFQNDEGYKWSSAIHGTVRFGTILSGSFIASSFLISLMAGAWFASRLSRGLKRLADQVATGAQGVSSSSTQVAASSSALSVGSNEQASAISKTVSALEQVSTMVEKTAESAVRSRDGANANLEAAQLGKKS